jgi:hypothetical protein
MRLERGASSGTKSSDSSGLSSKLLTMFVWVQGCTIGLHGARGGCCTSPARVVEAIITSRVRVRVNFFMFNLFKGIGSKDGRMIMKRFVINK